MRKKLIMLAWLIMILSWVGLAQADLIVDTGEATGSPNWGLSKLEWLAAEFNTGAHNTITRAEGKILKNSAGEVRAVIYTDGGEVPGTPVGFKDFLINPSGYSIGWFGADFDTPLTVAPYTDYWVAFEVGSQSTFSGVIFGSAPDPLVNEAINFLSNNFGYIPVDEIDIGVRVYDNPVPLPGTLMLLGSGLLGLGLWRKRQAG